MILGELFYALGLKGGKQAKKEVDSVSDGMINISKKGLAAITAITGVSLGLKYLYDNAMGVNKGLNQFSGITDLSIKELQKWQFIAKGAGSTADSMASSIAGVQSAIGNMLREGAPTKGFEFFADAVKLDWTKVKDTYYMMGKLREFMKMDSIDITTRNEVGQGMGLMISDIGAMRKSKMTPDQVPESVLRSESHVKAFSGAMNKFGILQDKIQITFEKLIVKTMPEFIKALDSAMPTINIFAEAAIRLATKIAEWIGMPEKLANDAKEFGGNLVSAPKDIWGKFKYDLSENRENLDKALKENFEKMRTEPTIMDVDSIKEFLFKADPRKGSSTPEIQINQYINGVTKDTAKPIGKEAGNAITRSINRGG